MAMYTPGTYRITVVTRNGRSVVSTKQATVTIRKPASDRDLKAMADRKLGRIFGYGVTTTYTITRP